VSTFEYIIIFFILVSILSGFAALMANHHSAWNAAQRLIETNFRVVECSFRSDAASIHYILTPPHACWDYSLALIPVSSPFLLVLGGDANHYG